ncbi:MAG: TIGR00730 family Rossman fold protein [Clostridia bacterium]|nr:TIGR00730 family Rossman fold protein [Clostridia bacterium]
MKNICIFGASRHCIAEKYFESAHRMGVLLGENGMDMVFGGGDHGLMGAAARGVREAGGRIVGVIPEKLNQPGIAFSECDELIVTPTMHTRKAAMEDMSDGFIGLPGGFGTVEEIMEVITLKQLGYLDAPIVLLNQDGFFGPLLAQFTLCMEESFADRAYSHMYAAVATPEEAMAYLLAYTPAALPDKIKDVLQR